MTVVNSHVTIRVTNLIPMPYKNAPYRDSIYRDKPRPLDNATAHELANLMRAEIDTQPEIHVLKEHTSADYTRALRNVELLIELAQKESTADKALMALSRLGVTAFFESVQAFALVGKVTGGSATSIEPDQDIEILRQKAIQNLTDAALKLRQLKEKAAQYKK